MLLVYPPQRERGRLESTQAAPEGQPRETRFTKQEAAFVHISWCSQIKPGFGDGVLLTDSPHPKVLKKERKRTEERGKLSQEETQMRTNSLFPFQRIFLQVI